jgi:hypothetical protein
LEYDRKRFRENGFRYKGKTGAEYQSEWRKKNPEKHKAHIKAQRIKIEKCEVCGSMENLERHHPDYSKPKVIVALCATHHKRLHFEVRNETY